MNNEPVAWMYEYGTDRGDAVHGISWYPNVRFKKPDLGGLVRNIEPLYTHPAKTQDRELLDKTIIDQQNEIKELRKNLDVALMIVNEPAKTLTDEEIYNLWFNYGCGMPWTANTKTFARAILRKAREE